MNCWGKEARKSIVSEYYLTQIAHLKILNGQEKNSCTGRTLTDNYFLFEYVSKKNSEEKGSFFCGSGAGYHFLKLLNQRALPLFNPLRQDIDVNNHRGGNDRRQKVQEWNSVTKQLVQALNILIVVENIAPRPGPITNILKKKYQYRDREPFDSDIKSVNTILGKFLGGLTLQEMLNELRLNGEQIRNFDFGLLNARLQEQKIDSNFG